MTISWPLSRLTVPDPNGRPRLDVRARFFAGGTTTPIPVFADAGLAQALPQPVVCDANGRFPRVFLKEGLYAEEVTSLATGLLWRDDGLGVPAPADEEEAPSTDPTALLTTGDVKWRPDGGLQPGFVRMNGRTIGALGSSATERANDDTRALYRHLYTTFGDDIALVIGGRGQGWEEDFTALKPITVPSMQGCLQAGLDTMGAPSADRLQSTVQLTITQGSTQASSTGTAQLAIGMVVVADGVSAGTQITDVAGSAVALSSPASLSGTVTARCGSVDSSKPGALGGDKLRGLGVRNLPPQLPNGIATVDDPPFTVPRYAELVQINAGDGGTVQQYPGVWRAATGFETDPPPFTAPVSTPNPNGGVAFSLTQALRVGTYFMKL